VGTGAERLGDILDGAVVRPAKRARSMMTRVRRKWVRAAGEDLAAHCWPRSVRRGVLKVEVDSSALLAELAGYRATELVHKLAAEPDPVGVRDIRFVLAEGEG